MQHLEIKKIGVIIIQVQTTTEQHKTATQNKRKKKMLQTFIDKVID